MSRAVLAASGVLLGVSLFVPWFAGTSGWEHWAWADVVLIVLAADLVVAAFLRPSVALRAALAVLCGLGVAVVLGHGFEPRVRPSAFDDVGAGPYLALVALAAGAVASLVPGPRVAAPLLLVVAGGGLVAALLSGWGIGDVPLSVGGDEVRLYAEPDGLERWNVLDVALLALAAGLVVAAARRLPRAFGWALAAACVAAAACVLVGAETRAWTGDGGDAEALAMGPLVALLALAGALAGLALRGSHTAASR